MFIYSVLFISREIMRYVKRPIRVNIGHMKMIVGLGNPGTEYENTRHNTGFKVIDEIAALWHVSVDKKKGKSLYGVYGTGEDRVVLLKPQTYMNLSGESLRQMMDFYKILPEDIIVIYDDMDLPLGSVRLRAKGSAGSHNGMKSILQHAGTNEIKRIRVGVGSHGFADAKDYVLGHFTKEDSEEITKAVRYAANAAIDAMMKPFERVMNDYNKKQNG